jgi:hypothetical protein
MRPLVAKALELTDRVQNAIDGGDWAQAQEIETQRRAVLEELAAAALSGAELAPTFAALAERNHRLIGLVEHHRRRVLREAAVARTARDAAAAYTASDPSA